MYLSQKALKDWQQVNSREEMINWHKIYTPWLSHSLIINLDKIYQENLRAVEKNHLTLIKNLGITQEYFQKEEKGMDQRSQKKKLKLQKKWKQRNFQSNSKQKEEESEKRIEVMIPNRQVEEVHKEVNHHQTTENNKTELKAYQTVAVTKEAEEENHLKKDIIPQLNQLSMNTDNHLKSTKTNSELENDENEYKELEKRINTLINQENTKEFIDLYLKSL